MAQYCRVSPEDDLGKWSFFLSKAAEFEPDDLIRLLSAREFAKATGVIKMISQTPAERMQYEARRKAELDYNSFLRCAVEEAVHEAVEEASEKALAQGVEQGLEQGLEQGRRLGLKAGLVSQIQFIQNLLKEPVAAESDLLAMELEELTGLCAALKARVSMPNSSN